VRLRGFPNSVVSQLASAARSSLYMKIVVIGASGPIGCKLVATLHEGGHHTVAASPDRGVDTLTGEGLAAALAGASVVVDVSDALSLADADTSTRNLLAAEAAAGVGHHVALSVVGTQEELIRESSIPYSIVVATQIVAADVVAALGRIAVVPPVNGIIEVSATRAHS
jgi:uncharacterized protein YbjT (DUF2867 family)